MVLVGIRCPQSAVPVKNPPEEKIEVHTYNNRIEMIRNTVYIAETCL
jgi:hypothetical protein